MVDGEALLVVADLNHLVELRRKKSMEQVGTKPHTQASPHSGLCIHGEEI